MKRKENMFEIDSIELVHQIIKKQTILSKED